MEMPFDYVGRPGLDPCPTPPETRIGGFETHDEDGCGYTSYILYEFCSLADESEINERVHELHPSRRCTHDYDCCGNTYPSYASWSFASRLDRGTLTQTVLVRQRWIVNV